jgi:tRNA threonylcarbamoyladenosine biosynthesis protein TsaE
LIKSLCQALGVTSNVQSPTFALVNEYEGAKQRIIYHFDFYRIKDELEALDIGIEEYFDQGDYCFVEWPGKIESLWPEHYLLLELHLDSDTGERVLAVSKVG